MEGGLEERFGTMRPMGNAEALAIALPVLITLR